MKLQIVLCCLNYNFVLTEDKPIINPIATYAQKAATQVSIDKWIKTNKMSILITKPSIDPIMFREISEKENAKDLLVVMKHPFDRSVKSRQYSGVHRNFQTNFKFWSHFRFGNKPLCVIF